MSEEDGREGTVGDATRPGAALLQGLSPHSYTATRLHHASERHLHLTTRRTFIGPIPDAWISKHRKAWYKYKPRMLTYSSKTASFNAAKSAADFRHLTGLDVQEEGDENQPKHYGLSFPQPEDVDEATGTGQERVPGQQHDGPRSPFEDRQRRSSDGKSLGSPRLSNGHQPNGVSSPRISHPSAGRGQPKAGQSSSSEARSFVTARRGKDHSGTSFVTAKESPGSSPPGLGLAPRLHEESNSPEATPPASDEAERKRYSASTTGQLDDVGGALRKSGSDRESIVPLLQHDGTVMEPESSPSASRPVIKVDTAVQDRGKRPDIVKELEEQKTQDDNVPTRKSSSKHALLEVPAEAYQEDYQDRAASPSSLHGVQPVTTGLVRFNIPNELVDKGQRAKGRVAEATSKASFQISRKAEAEPGQLLKAERMLVRVDATKHELPDNYSENDSLKAETTTVEKWREFIVTCRRSSEEKTEFVIQMNKTRVIPMLDKEHRSKKSAHSINLLQKVTKVNMFSSLDKTIVIWMPRGKGTRIYLLRPRSSASSVEWFTFLNFILGWQNPSRLTVHVPDLDVNLELRNPLKDGDVLKKSSEQADSGTQAESSVAKVADGQVAREIINRSIEALQQSDFEDILETWSEEGERIGLAWKRYDRLEWIHGANEERMYGSMAMQKTHDLELRPKRHYPTHVAKHPDQTMEEPSPIEGFMVRQTSLKGTHKRFGKTFFKRLYFSTHDNFLCFSEPGKALPPKPPELLNTDNSGLPTASEIAKMIPLIYPVDPFPLQDGHIPWLSSGNKKRKVAMDQSAYEENERSIKLLLESEGYINLCHVVRVHRLRTKTSAPPEQGQEATIDFEDSGTQGQQENADEARTLEIELKNGLVVRLQAFNRDTRQKWVQSLREIVEYWKLRTAEDMDIYKQVRQSNLETLNIDEETESYIGLEAQKWEVSRSIASPELFHMCGISCCRQVTMSGVLYRKPRVHSSFRKCVVILCHGKLLIFQSTLRAKAGREVPHILHQREQVVDLKDTYIYSGLLTESDLLYHNQTFDSNHPGHYALPRVYRDDNWTSVDEDTTTCFVVWHGRRKSFFRANAEEGDGGLKSRLRYVSSLGVPGRSMVFRTRSRAERDHWVMSISMEIERLQQAEDIRVVLGK